MVMYLFHQQLIYFVITCLYRTGINPYLYVAINFCVSILGSYGISLLMHKWRLTRFLVGEK